jgi:thiazole synthase
VQSPIATYSAKPPCAALTFEEAIGCLLNTGIASPKDPLRMAHAMKHACAAGRLAYLAGRIPRKLYATASNPWEGRIAGSM